jgi:hypothetical protein
MEKQDSLLRKMLFLFPRLVLWGVCMLYFVITLIITFDVFKPYLYPLENLRSSMTGSR